MSTHISAADRRLQERSASGSIRTWVFMMRSMLADQPNLEVTSATGESARRRLTTTRSTRSPSALFIASASGASSFSASSFCGSVAGCRAWVRRQTHKRPKHNKSLTADDAFSASSFCAAEQGHRA